MTEQVLRHGGVVPRVGGTEHCSGCGSNSTPPASGSGNGSYSVPTKNHSASQAPADPIDRLLKGLREGNKVEINSANSLSGLNYWQPLKIDHAKSKHPHKKEPKLSKREAELPAFLMRIENFSKINEGLRAKPVIIVGPTNEERSARGEFGTIHFGFDSKNVSISVPESNPSPLTMGATLRTRTWNGQVRFMNKAGIREGVGRLGLEGEALSMGKAGGVVFLLQLGLVFSEGLESWNLHFELNRRWDGTQRLIIETDQFDQWAKQNGPVVKIGGQLPDGSLSPHTFIISGRENHPAYLAKGPDGRVWVYPRWTDRDHIELPDGSFMRLKDSGLGFPTFIPFPNLVQAAQESGPPAELPLYSNRLLTYDPRQAPPHSTPFQTKLKPLHKMVWDFLTGK